MIYALQFRGNVTVAGKAFSGTTETNSLGLIAIKPDGSGHDWAVELQGFSDPNNPDGIRVTSMLMDNNGAIYLLGTFVNKIVFPNATLSPPQGQLPARHGFIAKLNAQQQWENLKMIRLSETSGVNDIRLDTYALVRASNGDFYVSGIFKGKISLDTLNAEDSNPQLFVMHLGSDFAGKSITTSTATQGVNRVNLVVDGMDRLYLSTTFVDSITLGGQALNASAKGETARAIAHLDFGNTRVPWKWSFLIPGGDDDTRDILADSSGGVLFSSSYRDAFQLGTTNLPKPNHPTALLASVDPQGQIRWIKSPTSNGMTGGNMLERAANGRTLWLISNASSAQIDGLSALSPVVGDPFAASVYSFDNNGKALTVATLTSIYSLLSGFEGNSNAFQLKEQSLLLGGRIRQDTFVYGKIYSITGIEDPFSSRFFFQ